MMKMFFWGEKIPTVTALDVIKCLKQLKYKRLLFACGPISELPSNTSTMNIVTVYRVSSNSNRVRGQKAYHAGYTGIMIVIYSCTFM